MSQANHVAATVSSLSGVVTVQRHGNTVELKIGDPIYASDTIKTGNGAIEISFIDGAKAMLGPSSVMSVQEFAMGNAETEPAFVLNLAAGALRSISGALVEQNPDAFKVITPKATAGIRGTDFSIQILDDGGERIVVRELSQGHNVVVTTHSGSQVVLVSMFEGAEIAADGTSITTAQYTKEEVEQIVQDIIEAIQGEEQSEASTDQVTLLLDSESAQALQAAGLLDDFVDTAMTEGASVGIEGGEEFLEPQEITEVLHSDSDSGAGEGEEGPAPLIPASTTGTTPYFADDITPVAGNVYNLSSQHVVVENAITSSSVTISGDVDDISAGTVNAGSDEISASSMSDGRIVGDTNGMTGGTLMAGNDTISLSGDKTGGNSLYGDVGTANGGTAYFGDDSIVIQGNFSNSYISGDIGTIENLNVQKWGNDIIRIDGTMSNGAYIYGDGGSSDSEGGNDYISIGVMDGASGASIGVYGEGGNDVITIGSGTGSISVHGGDGNDSITLGFVSTSFAINAGNGDDTITIESLGSIGPFTSQQGTINVGEGNDVINVTNHNGEEAEVTLVGVGLGDTVIANGYELTDSELETALAKGFYYSSALTINFS